MKTTVVAINPELKFQPVFLKSCLFAYPLTDKHWNPVFSDPFLLMITFVCLSYASLLHLTRWTPAEARIGLHHLQKSMQLCAGDIFLTAYALFHDQLSYQDPILQQKKNPGQPLQWFFTICCWINRGKKEWLWSSGYPTAPYVLGDPCSLCKFFLPWSQNYCFVHGKANIF